MSSIKFSSYGTVSVFNEYFRVHDPVVSFSLDKRTNIRDAQGYLQARLIDFIVHRCEDPTLRKWLMCFVYHSLNLDELLLMIINICEEDSLPNFYYDFKKGFI